MPKGLPFRLGYYLELVDWTGRQFREDKRGAIAQNLPPILDRLGIEPKHWLSMELPTSRAASRAWWGGLCGEGGLPAIGIPPQSRTGQL